MNYNADYADYPDYPDYTGNDIYIYTYIRT